jgi:hypothetical protein
MRIGLPPPWRHRSRESEASQKEMAMHEIPTRVPGDCLGQTCLKWQPDGELSAVDRHLVLERLLQADGCPSPLTECWVWSGDPQR